MNSQYDGIPAARDSWGSGNDHQQPGWDAEGDNGWEGKTTGDDLKNGWQVTEKGNKPKGAWGRHLRSVPPMGHHHLLP
ncbi:hypothetical protein HBI53_020030 [Parastagonospora nodorum]|nr:hypothetical protein HBI53_020030 [Parastagonospora nodorum]